MSSKLLKEYRGARNTWHVIGEMRLFAFSHPFFFGDAMRKAEIAYQAKLIKKLQTIFPDCWILKNDPSENQGIPDILILWGCRWAMLEVKISEDAPARPNQPYYVDMFNRMSFAAFISPEVEEQVLHELQSTLRAA
jgi:hypothetical protein